MQVLILLDLNRMILFHIPRISVTLTELDNKIAENFNLVRFDLLFIRGRDSREW